jgi:hypothetical protein
MYKLDITKVQGQIVHEVVTHVYHLVTEDGLEFRVHHEDGWDYSTYYTNLSKEGTEVGVLREVEWDEPLQDFLMETDFSEEK